MKICLTANSGGHLNQLLQLKQLQRDNDCFFITNKTRFSEELAQSRRVYFVDKVIIREAIKKARFGAPLRNIFQSLKPLLNEKPDVIITTGAGASLGACLIGKLLGCRVVFIESIARTSQPSTFGKAVKHLANKIFVQWPDLVAHYKNASHAGIIFDFNHLHDGSFEEKEPRNILVTFGTYNLQFNRILIELDRLKEANRLPAEIVAQTGDSDYQPRQFEHFAYCEQSKMHALVDNCDLVICQGGSGSIMDSLLKGKKVIAIPRRVAFGEFFDDHQVELVNQMEKAGLILAVHDIKDLMDAIEASRTFRPRLDSLKNSPFSQTLQQYLAAT